jgi:hypothetical protein
MACLECQIWEVESRDTHPGMDCALVDWSSAHCHLSAQHISPRTSVWPITNRKIESREMAQMSWPLQKKFNRRNSMHQLWLEDNICLQCPKMQIDLTIQISFKMVVSLFFVHKQILKEEIKINASHRNWMYASDYFASQLDTVDHINKIQKGDRCFGQNTFFC